MRSIKFAHRGKNVHFFPGCRLVRPDRITIEDNVHIGSEARLNAIGGLTIKSGVIIGPRIAIYTANHNYDNYVNATKLPYDEEIISQPVTIGENCWIGGNEVIPELNWARVV